MGAQSRQTARRLPRETSRGPSGDRGTPRYSTTSSRGAWRCKRGRRGSPRPCGRSATLAYAARRNRARGHCRTTDTPQPPHWTASVKASRALSQHLLRLRPSRASEATDRPSPLSYPTAPGARREPGARLIVLRGGSRGLGSREPSRCSVGSVRMRRSAAPATAARHRVQRGDKNFSVDPARRRPIACARRCARAPAGAAAGDWRQGCGGGLRDGSPTGQHRRRPAARHHRGRGPQPRGPAARAHHPAGAERSRPGRNPARRAGHPDDP